MWRLAAVALVAVACGSVTVQAQTLTLAYAKGTTYHYTVHMTSEYALNSGAINEPAKLDMKAKETVSVNSVDASGVADVSVTFSDSTMTMSMGTSQSKTTITQTQAMFPTLDVKIAADGRVLSVNGTSISTEMSFGVGMGNGIVSAVLPDNAVKPGDSWSKTYDQPGPLGSGSIHITANSKYLRNEKFHGVQAAVVETKSTASYDFTQSFSGQANAGDKSSLSLKGTTTADVTSWIDPSAHRLLKTLMKATSELTMSMSLGAPPAGAVPGMPIGPAGPFTIKGVETFDLEPA